MKISFLSSNNNFSIPILREFQKRHEVCQLKTTNNVKLDRLGSFLAWGDLLYCEWCDDLLKIALDIRPDMPTVARLHKYELWTPTFYQIQFDKVDLLIYNIASNYTQKKFHQKMQLKPAEDRIMPDGVDLDFWKFNTREFKKPYRMCIVGRIFPLKGQYELLRMFADLKDKEFLLSIVGNPDGMYGENVLSAIKRLDLVEQVEIVPHMPRESLAVFLGGQDIIISNSRDEGNHTIIKEAMVTGCYPLINFWEGADQTYDKKHIFNTQLGFVGLVDQWKRKKDKLKASQESRTYIEERYNVNESAKKVVDACEEVYEKCLKTKKTQKT